MKKTIKLRRKESRTWCRRNTQTRISYTHTLYTTESNKFFNRHLHEREVGEAFKPVTVRISALRDIVYHRFKFYFFQKITCERMNLWKLIDTQNTPWYSCPYLTAHFMSCQKKPNIYTHKRSIISSPTYRSDQVYMYVTTHTFNPRSKTTQKQNLKRKWKNKDEIRCKGDETMCYQKILILGFQSLNCIWPKNPRLLFPANT